MNETNKKSVRNSTVAISHTDAKRLDDFCVKIGVSKKDFITLSLNYFLKNGIDPTTHETPSSEVAKITKRIDQFFAFFKKQEQDILRPMYADLIQSNKKTVEISAKTFQNQMALSEMIVGLDNSYTKKTKEITDEIKNIITKIDNNKRTSDNDTKRLKEDLTQLLNYIDPKNKSGLFGKLFG